MVEEVVRGHAGSVPSESSFRARLVLRLIVLAVISHSIWPSAQQKPWTDLRQTSPGLASVISPTSEADACHDQYAELKCSPSVLGLSRWFGLSLESTSQVCGYFNFFLLVGLIYWKAKPILATVAQERSRSIKWAIEKAQRLSDEARSRLAEIEKRWAQIDHELAAIRARAETQFKQELDLMAGKTAEDVRRILENSEREIGAAVRHTRSELKAFAADLVVSVARQSIWIDENTDRKLIGAFVRELQPEKEGSLAASKTHS